MLREPQVMGVRRFSAANQTRVLGNRFDVSTISASISAIRWVPRANALSLPSAALSWPQR